MTYAGEVNPLIVTRHGSAKDHRAIVHRVNDEEADRDKRQWDPEKSLVKFAVRGEAVTLGMHVNWKLGFQPHIKPGTEQVERLWKIMCRLSNSRSGISPRATRARYTGAIRRIFTCVAELWNESHTRSNISSMIRVDYQALHKTTGGYFNTDSSITAAFYISAITSPKLKSYRDRDSTDPFPITDIELLAHQDERSKHRVLGRCDRADPRGGMEIQLYRRHREERMGSSYGIQPHAPTTSRPCCSSSQTHRQPS